MMSAPRHIAELNIGSFWRPLDDPRTAGLTDAHDFKTSMERSKGAAS